MQKVEKVLKIGSGVNVAAAELKFDKINRIRVKQLLAPAQHI
jgi:hypothetical protein